VAVVVAFLPGAAVATAPDTLPLRVRLAWQIALERVCLSPGILDGRIGPKTRLAVREFQRVRRLPRTGRLDEATASLLGVDRARALGSYTVTGEDVRRVGPVPRSWLAKSRLSYLGYPSLVELVAEKFHCSRSLLAALNPGKSLRRLRAGDRLVVPAVAPTRPPKVVGDRLDVDLSARVIRVCAGNRLLGLFHCSIAADRAKRPSSTTVITTIVESPSYTFRPEMWPNVTSVRGPLSIPPGPRNPVGLCWIGLGLPGYGIHGTPAPELIGKTGSHGCFRLTNWDVLRLRHMTRVGATVSFAHR